jgi:carbamoyl-phosphate synthase large subunit
LSGFRKKTPIVNILITSASRKVSLVRAFQSALAASGGGNVVAVDASPQAPALYFADRRFLVPPSNAPHFVDQILAICNRENVALLIPTRDEELPIFAGVRGQFEQAGTRVMVPRPETVQTCFDKMAFVDFCRARGFGIPRTYVQAQLGSSDFPVFVKPRFGKSSKGARRVVRQEELHAVAEQPEQWVIQENIDWPEYTVDLLADFQGRVLSVIPRLRQLVVGGESYVSRTVNSPELIEVTTRLATDLRLVGHNTIQCFWNGKQVKFVEVNPRFGGGAALGIASGGDTPKMLIALAAGESVPAQVGQFQTDLVMLRFTEDLFLKADALITEAEGVQESNRKPAKSNRKSKRAVLFDLDNTLYPEEQFVIGGFRAAAQCLATHVGLDAAALLEQMLQILHAEGRGRVFDTVLRTLEIDSSTWLPVLLHEYRSHRPVLSLFPETGGILRVLKDRELPLGLVTDGLASTQRRKIAALGLEAYMDAIVCTGELGRGCSKPSPIPFKVALTLLDVAPEDAAYIADNVTKDFAGPNQLGMKSVQVCSPGLIGVRAKAPLNDSSFLPQMKAESLTEALTLLGLW